MAKKRTAVISKDKITAVRMIPRTGSSHMMRTFIQLDIPIAGRKGFYGQMRGIPAAKERILELNPDGYYETPHVSRGFKSLPEMCNGKAVKLMLSARVPDSCIEKTIVCIRDPASTIESQRKLLKSVFVSSDDEFKNIDRMLGRSAAMYKAELASFILSPPADPCLIVDYSEWANADETIKKIADFMGVPVVGDHDVKYRPPVESSDFDDDDAIELYEAVKSGTFDKSLIRLADSVRVGLSCERTTIFDDGRDGMPGSFQTVTPDFLRTYVVSEKLQNSIAEWKDKCGRKKLFSSNCKYREAVNNDDHMVELPSDLPPIHLPLVQCHRDDIATSAAQCQKCWQFGGERNRQFPEINNAD
jgi:hypothetical protein